MSTHNVTDQEQSSEKSRRIAFIVLLAGVVCMGMGQTITFAVLPPLAREIGFADAQIGAIFMLSAVFWVTMSPFWGRQSDSGGRRKFILLGLAGYVLSTTLFASTLRLGLTGAASGVGLYIVVVITRSIYGLVGSAMPSAAQAYIADRTTPDKRTSGLAGFSAAFGFGAVIGPAFGGAMSAFGPLAPLYGIAALAALAMTTVFFLLPEKTPPKESAVKPKLSPFDKRIRIFLGYGLAASLTMAVPIQLTGFYFIDTLKLSSAEALELVGIGLSASAMASLFSQLVLVQRFNLTPLSLMRAGPMLMFCGHAIIVISSAFGPLVFGLMLSGLGAGMITPSFVAASSLAVTPDEQGATAGLSNSAIASGFIFSPLIGFSLYAVDPRAPFLMTTLIAASLAIFAWTNKKIRVGEPKTS